MDTLSRFALLWPLGLLAACTGAPTVEEASVGDTELARMFYAGRYDEILAITYDADGSVPPADVAFVVGALTFIPALALGPVVEHLQLQGVAATH